MKKKRSKIMTQARIQPYVRKLGINLGCYNGKEIWPRFITEFCFVCLYFSLLFNQEI